MRSEFVEGLQASGFIMQRLCLVITCERLGQALLATKHINIADCERCLRPAQFRETMRDALAVFAQGKAAVSTAMRHAASWPGQSHTYSVSLAQLHQVCNLTSVPMAGCCCCSSRRLTLLEPADAGCGANFLGDGLSGALAEAPVACRLCVPVDLDLFSGPAPGLLGTEDARPASGRCLGTTPDCFVIAGVAGTSTGLAGAETSMDADF